MSFLEALAAAMLLGVVLGAAYFVIKFVLYIVTGLLFLVVSAALIDTWRNK